MKLRAWCIKLKLNALQEMNLDDCIQYLGIAADEPERIKRHTKPNVELPLVAIDWEEDMCGLECEYMDLLSPTYATSARGGCWFCNKQSLNQLRLLRKEYPELWEILLKWDDDSPYSFHDDGHTVHDFDRRFALEDEGLIDPTDHFRWAMLDEELNYNLFLLEEHND